MIKDRLPELKEILYSINNSNESLVLIEDDEVEEYFVRDHNPIMDALLKMYSEIFYGFDLITANIESMKIMTQAKNSKEFCERDFNKLRQRGVQLGNNLMNKFQNIEVNLPAENDYTTLARMKRLLFYGSFQQYVIVWTKNEEFLQEYEQKIRKNLQMQSKILNYDLTDEEIESLIAYKQTSLYTGNILETEHARSKLKALKDRLDELKKLEKSIEEVHTLFLRLQTLVVEQSAVMQSIEKHFNDARNYVEQGTEELKQAEVIHSENMKYRSIVQSIARKASSQVYKMIGVRDILPELKKKMQNENSSGDIEADLDEYEVIRRPHNTSVKNLLNMYANIFDQFKNMDNQLSKMQSMVKADYSNQFSQKEFDKTRRDNQQISNNIVKKFKKLESKLPQTEDFSTLARMKRLLYHGFFYRYVKLWTKNDEFLLEYEESIKKKLKMQSQILNCNLTDEDIETMIENKNTNLFMSNILQDTETERKKLEELKDRFEDLKKLEKSITEVHNLFVGLQALVEEQGEILQRIETHYEATRHYIEEGILQINIARNLKKKRCCHSIFFC